MNDVNLSTNDVKLSTALEQGSVELRCGQCEINQENSVETYPPNLVGTLHLAGGHTLVFTEHQRVAVAGRDEQRYPISYQPLTDSPSPEDWLLLGTQRGQEANLVNAGLAGTIRYDYTRSHPTRLVQQTTSHGIHTRCRSEHQLAVTTEELLIMLDQPLPYSGGTYLPPADR